MKNVCRHKFPRQKILVIEFLFFFSRRQKLSAHLVRRHIDMLSTEKYELDPSYRGQTGSSIGISTVGYRSNKYNPNEWHENNYAKYYQTFTDRDQSEKQRWQATRTENETLALSQQTQALSTKKLQQRFVINRGGDLGKMIFFLLLSF